MRKEWNHHSSSPQFILLLKFLFHKKMYLYIYCVFMYWWIYFYGVYFQDCYCLFKNYWFLFLFCLWWLMFLKNEGFLFSLTAVKGSFFWNTSSSRSHNSLISVNSVNVKWYLIIIFIYISMTHIFPGYLIILFCEFSLKNLCLYCFYP